jgi:2-oxoglutarate decarboxylase
MIKDVPATGSSPPGGHQPAVQGAVAGMVPIRGAAAALVRHMENSLRVPTATTMRTFSVRGLDETVARLARLGRTVSASRILAFCVARAATAVPEITQRFVTTDHGPVRAKGEGVRLGIAVDTRGKDGCRQVIVPVIPDAGSLGFAEFVEVYERLIQAARSGSLSVANLAGANLVLTNTGAFGSTTGIPRLPEGPGAVVALGALGYPAGLESVGERLGIDRVCTASCTYDHRVIQGGDSGTFLQALVDLLSPDSELLREVEAEAGAEAGQDRATVRVSPRPLAADALMPLEDLLSVVRLVETIRRKGHRSARLDPLTSEPRSADWMLDPDLLARVAALDSSQLRLYLPPQPLAGALRRLEQIYRGTLTIEVDHLDLEQEREWWYRLFEESAGPPALDDSARIAILERLVAIDELETFLQRSYPGEKTLSVEGLDATVLMTGSLVALAALAGADHVSIGMAHRGRLNILVHVLQMPYLRLLLEFEAATREDAARRDAKVGDVRQHLGWHTTVPIDGREVSVTLLPNPSHLEFVTPVTLGATRAHQDDARLKQEGSEATNVASTALAVILHGDASFTGQGIVAEALNLHQVPGFQVGGAVHIVQDNQLGFTTGPEKLRSTRWPSDLAKGYDLPVVHVNADDPEACLKAARMALAFRNRFAKDVVVHVVGYRRLGHTEADEPTFTQPELYHRIRNHAKVADSYARHLVADGVIIPEAVETWRAATRARLRDAHQEARSSRPEPVSPEPATVADTTPQPTTAELALLNEKILAVPDGFALHPKVERVMTRRRDGFARNRLDWAHCEALALGIIGRLGVCVRLTGQDCTRGAFTQRHLALWPTDGGPPYHPLATATKGLVQLFDSPLSEAAVLGYEYGYSTARPDALVVWEAQFGDFANSAQVIIDQFLSSGHDKWGAQSRLTVLLPHGYEGAGPEHSSARIERYLQLAARDNVRIALPTTPAQYFHLLLEQATVAPPRPLVVFTAKSLLRHRQAVSSVEQLARGGFTTMLVDLLAAAPGNVRRAFLCSGKIYYDLIGVLGQAQVNDAVVMRVEQLYPFPSVADSLRQFPALTEAAWVQEEPENMGPARHMLRCLGESEPGVGHLRLRYIGRPAMAAVAEGYGVDHKRAQAQLLGDLL